jgi:hypothetical protein
MKKIVFTRQELSGKLNSLLLSKKFTGKFFSAILFVIILLPLSASAQECSLMLTAKNNIESVNSEGRVYFIELKNSTNEEISVAFTVSNNNTGINPDETGSSENVNLNAEVLDKNGLALTGNVNLTPNETLELQVKVTVPSGTPINHWNITLLKASSTKCNNYSTSLNLNTFIPIPE